MKIIKLISEIAIKIIGNDNNRFYALLLFIALMFALWILYKRDAPRHSNGDQKTSCESVSRFE